MSSMVRMIALLSAALSLLAGQYYPYGTPKPGSFKTIAGSFHGKLKELTGKEITIETGEDQLVTLHRSRKTKFFKGKQEIKASDIDVGTMVTVEAHEEPADLSLTALAVIVETPKKQGEGEK